VAMSIDLLLYFTNAVVDSIESSVSGRAANYVKNIEMG
jgi:hypothetical protein